MADEGGDMPANERDENARATGTGTGPILSYNVPQDVTYSGQHYIEIQLAPEDFIATARGRLAGQGAAR
jgi:hypothetical protein